jgi:pimeloyl-ACP methyl ester carboxylesterase
VKQLTISPPSAILHPMQLITGSTTTALEVRGLRFNVLEWGDPAAPPMVLLHGLTGHAHTWDHMAPALAERYHVFVPDQRGHGDSSHADTYRTQDFVDDLAAFAAAWDIGRLVLVGLSMGGHNAMAFAATHPERVSHLVVIDIPPRMDRSKAPNWNVISKLAETGHHRYLTLDEAFADARAGNQTAPEENLRYRTDLNLIKHGDGTMTLKYDPKAPARWEPEDLTDKLSKITAPVLVVRGALTTVLPRDAAERMSSLFRDAELVEIPESGHSVPTDKPEKLTPVLLDWLSRRARA